MAKCWVYNPHAGGVKITDARRNQVLLRVEDHWQAKLADKADRLTVRFHGALCYVAAEQRRPDGSTVTMPLCRLRHFDMERWSLALYTYSNEKYEPCRFSDGEWHGTIEDALDLSVSFLE